MFKKIAAAALTLVALASAHAAPVLVSQSPWGQQSDVTNMTAVFGAGNFITYSAYSGLNASTIFTAANQMVLLEGGADTDVALQKFLTGNSNTILSWVNAGGALMIQSAGWSSNVAFNGVTLQMNRYSNCGEMTAAGAAAMPGATSACGNYVSHDIVIGNGLTSLVSGSAGSIVAGMDVGNGYITYSGLTSSSFHTNANLMNGVVRYTASQAGQVPEPASLALVGMAFLAVGVVRRRKSA